ncbi:hypothetical protein KAZ82_02210, partial [Candidatus Babeliales bacterium]|nr:hypothetical protein [Candidatus Babeliales bacterium]
YHPDKVTGENEKLLKILQARDALLNDFDKSQDAQPVLLLEETVRPEIERMESEGGVGSRPLPVESEEIAEALTLELQPEVIEVPSLSKELLVLSPEKDVVIHSELKKELQPFVSPKQSIIVTKEAVLPQQPKIISSMKSTEEHIVTPDKGIDDLEFRDRMKQKISGYKPSEFVETSTESNSQLSKQTQLPKKAAQRAKEKIKFGSEGIDIVKKASQITQPVAKTQVKIIQGSGMASMLKKPKIPKMPLGVVLQSNPELKEDMEIRKYAAQAGGMIMQPTAEELAVERQRQLEQLLAYQEQQKQMQEQIAMQEPIQDWLVKYPQSLQPPDIAAGLSPTVSETASLGALAKYIERLKLRK